MQRLPFLLGSMGNAGPAGIEVRNATEVDTTVRSGRGLGKPESNRSIRSDLANRGHVPMAGRRSCRCSRNHNLMVGPQMCVLRVPKHWCFQPARQRCSRQGLANESFFYFHSNRSNLVRHRIADWHSSPCAPLLCDEWQSVCRSSQISKHMLFAGSLLCQRLKCLQLHQLLLRK